jgi:hypothetical protein
LSRSAARWKPPQSATATKARNNSNSIMAINPIQQSIIS